MPATCAPGAPVVPQERRVHRGVGTRLLLAPILLAGLALPGSNGPGPAPATAPTTLSSAGEAAHARAARAIDSPPVLAAPRPPRLRSSRSRRRPPSAHRVIARSTRPSSVLNGCAGPEWREHRLARARASLRSDVLP